MFSFQEIAIIIDKIDASIETLNDLMTEPEALTKQQRGEIGKIIAEYKWLPIDLTLLQLNDIQNELEDLVKKYK